MPCSLALESVGVRYRGGHQAVDAVGLSLGPGILGLLGPNGAGKSSLMRVLATLARPSQGRVLWRGEDTARKPDALRRELGYLPQDFGVYEALSAREFLAFLAAVKGLQAKAVAARVDECLAMVGLEEVADRRLGDYSGGMRQRVGIAQALLNDPKLLIVDEPTVGLDPEERVRLRNLLGDLATRATVILSTHIVEDISQSCNDLAVINLGKVLFRGSPRDLIAQTRGQVWHIVTAGERPDSGLSVVSTLQLQDGVQYRVLGAPGASYDAKPVEPSLEDGYIWLMQQSRA
jgi:ABC-type multidrug transport system ATPase subunit